MKVLLALAVLLSAQGLMSAPLSQIVLPKNGFQDTHKVIHQITDQDVVVVMEVGTKCPIVRRSYALIKKIAKDYAAKKVQFYLLDSAAHDTEESLAEEAKLFEVELPVIADFDQSLARLFGFRSTAQIAVIKNNQVFYRGALDDSINFEGQRPVTKPYLRDALDAVLAGKEPKNMETRTFGCMITFKKSETK